MLFQVILPHIHFSDADIMALQDLETVQEVQAMRLSHEACFQACLLLQTYGAFAVGYNAQTA